MKRQQIRRQAFKATKADRASMNRSLGEIALGEMRQKRKGREKIAGPTVIQGPGKLLPTRRAFKKPRGKPGWRVSVLGAIDCIERFGTTLPRCFEASFHSTKGLRVVRVLD